MLKDPESPDRVEHAATNASEEHASDASDCHDTQKLGPFVSVSFKQKLDKTVLSS